MEKISREEKLETLAKNIEIILNNENRKYLAITSDAPSYNVLAFVQEIAKVYVKMNKKVAILGYKEVEDKIDGVYYHKLDINKYSDNSFLETCDNYDIVLIDGPNPLSTKYYLHLSSFCKDVILVVKKWKSKVKNVNIIQEIAKENGFTFHGVVYQK